MLTVYAGGRTGPEGSHRPWSPQEIRHWPVRRDLGGGRLCLSWFPLSQRGPAGHTEGAQNKYI